MLQPDPEKKWSDLPPRDGDAEVAEEPLTEINDDWPALIPLPVADLGTGEYPVDALPSVLRTAAEEVARFTKVPPASPAVVGMSVVASAIGAKARIEERAGLDHNMALFHVLVAASGERKSPVFQRMTEPLQRWEADREETWRENCERAKAENVIVERIAKELEKQAGAEMTDNERASLVARIAAERASISEIPPRPRISTTDVTEQRLFQLMHERGGTFAVLSGEGRPVLDSIMGRHSGAGYMGDAIYLAGYSGDTITRDRVGNETTGAEDRVIRHPCLNVCIFVQPDKYLEAARHPRLRESGALARMWAVRLPSVTGQRFEAENEPGLDLGLIEPFASAVDAILAAEMPTDDDGHTVPHMVKLGAEAAAARRNWHNTIEGMMGDNHELADVRDIASKAVSATTKAAGVIDILDNSTILSAVTSTVDLATWQRAQFIGEYHLEEAITAQRNAIEDQTIALAKRIIAWTTNKQIGRFKPRDVQQKVLRPRPETVKEAEEACEVLVEHGYARRVDGRGAIFEMRPL